jgi:hypothetical protein
LFPIEGMEKLGFFSAQEVLKVVEQVMTGIKI